MGGKMSRNKGARFERFIVSALQACFPDAHRGQQAHNPRHADVEGTPFRIEAKHYAQLTYGQVLKALQQAADNGKEFGDDRIPIAITKVDRALPMVHMTLRAFVQLVERHFYSPPDLAEVVPIRAAPEDKK
ncbi:MAG TPA: hypothetical protein VMW58_09240 [Anaerolineae bacterium]|nr:hypothetical protein [Anaerolineae bacterium]